MNSEIPFSNGGGAQLYIRPLGRHKITDMRGLAESGSTVFQLLWECSSAFVPISMVKEVELTVENDRTITMKLYLNGGRPILQQFYMVEGSLENYILAKNGFKLLPELTASVNLHAGDEACFNLAKTWLETCCREHKECGARKATPLPSRLLEISQDDPSRIYLREFGEEMGVYAALSYCWGSPASRLKTLCNALKALHSHTEVPTDPQSDVSNVGSGIDRVNFDEFEYRETDLDKLKQLFNIQKLPQNIFDVIKMISGATPSTQRDIVATKSNMEELKRGFDVQRLPRTVFDAVKIARKLSVRYIWVDRLCIIQDDHDDWARESVNMWSIFANALFTISADRSPDVTSGILHEQRYGNWPRKIIQVQDLKAFVQPLMPHRYARQNLHSTYRQPPEEPVECRAWCFQENLASTRLLHYGSNEMIWECNERTLCECGRSQLSGYIRDKYFSSTLRSEPLETTVYHKWFQAVMPYSSKIMTRQTDKLPALSGTASATHGRIIAMSGQPDTYLAGLWRGDIARGLLWCYAELWRLQSYMTVIESNPRPQRSSECYRAPTWSWASVDRRIYWWHSPGDKFNSAVSVLDANAITKTEGNPYDEVESAYILLSGRARRGLRYVGWSEFEATLQKLGLHVSRIDMDEVDQILLHRGTFEVVLLYIGTASGSGYLRTAHYYLILKRSSRSVKLDSPLHFSRRDHSSGSNKPYERIGICIDAKWKDDSTGPDSNCYDEGNIEKDAGVPLRLFEQGTFYLV
ncbi:heterokaryon incompatibility protein-domain-containing protein [Xylaria sp. FL1777]|nr:heterokaryon incompatibility protein-domain-containing protein [Xylaria sp. FL1777]